MSFDDLLIHSAAVMADREISLNNLFFLDIEHQQIAAGNHLEIHTYSFTSIVFLFQLHATKG